MSNLDTINVGGINYDIEDATARPNAASALTITAYKEDDDTASQAYSIVGTPINWKGSLYYTTASIAAGATLAVGTNLVAATNIGQYLLTRTNRIRTYVGSDSKLHFTDATGADSVLPFSGSNFAKYTSSTKSRSLGSGNVTLFSTTLPKGHKYLVIWSWWKQAYNMTEAPSSNLSLQYTTNLGGNTGMRSYICDATNSNQTISIVNRFDDDNSGWYNYNHFHVFTIS